MLTATQQQVWQDSLIPVTYKWHVGNRALYEFEEVTVVRVDGSYGTVNHGGMETSGQLIPHLFPTTEVRCEIAKKYNTLYNGISIASGSLNLNWPKIHAYAVRSFEDAMRQVVHEDSRLSGDTALKDFTEFVTEIERKINEAFDLTVYGIPLFRRRVRI
jgi:hypothetical protein